ncbi:hypothetical protein R1sor_025273 [Riccia sorocarpa]|uniref:C2H2-type domain-containing protein n=1 Tax=Riccia sorocarpa TaxID=122646 RepID=A0ABD3GBF0_9MARC
MAEFRAFRQKVEDSSHLPFPSSAATSVMNFSGLQQQATRMPTSFLQVHASSTASGIGGRNAGNMQAGSNSQLGGGCAGGIHRAHGNLGGNQPNSQNAQQFMDLQSEMHMLASNGAPEKAGEYHGLGDPNLHAALVDIQQKIEKMQEFIRMNGNGGQANLQQQQEVASAVNLISQMTAAISEGMLNNNKVQNQNQNETQTPNMSMSDSSQLNHLFQGAMQSPSSGPRLNFLEYSSPPAVIPDTVLGNNGNNSFPGLHGPNNVNLNNCFGQNIAGNLSLGTGERVYGAVTTSKGSSVLPSETVGVGNLRHPQLNCNRRFDSPPSVISGLNNSSAKPSIRTSITTATSQLQANPGGSGSLGSDNQKFSKGQVVQKDEYDDGEGEVLAPGSYQLVELDDREIMAEHTHFCELCGKGFKRDANLRMHMRSHGDEYKTPEALARPIRPIDEQKPEIPKRFSCPHVGCKRNVKHRKFQPLKSLLCVKNHYRRSHCAKILVCMLVRYYLLQEGQAVRTCRSATYEQNPFAEQAKWTSLSFT